MSKGRDKVGDKKGHYPSSVNRTKYECSSHRMSSGNRGIDEKWTRMAKHRWVDNFDPIEYRPINGKWTGYKPNSSLPRFNPKKWAVVKA